MYTYLLLLVCLLFPLPEDFLDGGGHDGSVLPNKAFVPERGNTYVFEQAGLYTIHTHTHPYTPHTRSQNKTKERYMRQSKPASLASSSPLS